LAWQIKITPQAEKDLSKIDRQNARRITRFLYDRVIPDPRSVGKSLKGQLREFWRYRVGDYRILAKIEDSQLLILVVHIGHRKKIYGGR
jgi:mRNA interferase RelE/StbE